MFDSRKFASGIVALGLAVQVGAPLPADGPIAYLGSTFDTSHCQVTKLRIGSGTTALCGEWSAIMTSDGVVRVISLYQNYEGKLPEGLAWGDPISQVAKSLGKPRRVTDMYGTPTMIYMYDSEPYGSLELRFDTKDELYRINACDTH